MKAQPIRFQNRFHRQINMSAGKPHHQAQAHRFIP
jgi:hypothetical protein